MDFFRSDMFAVMIWSFNLLLVNGCLINTIVKQRFNQVAGWQLLCMWIIGIHLMRLVATYKPFMVH